MNGVEEAKSIINEILQRSEFQPQEKANLDPIRNILDFIKNIVEKILDFIKKLLESLFGRTSSHTPNPSKGSDINILLILQFFLLILIIALIVFLVIKILKSKGWNKKIKSITEEEIDSFVKDTDLPYTLAEQYKKEGDFRLSLRYLYISLLIQLNKKEIIKIDKSKTNRQYLREVKENQSDIHEVFGEFTDIFAYHWYGYRTTTPEILDIWFDKYKLILERGADTNGKK